MESSLIGQGLALMLVGMGTVFVFLTLLVATMSAMSAAVARFTPPAPPPGQPCRIQRSAGTSRPQRRLWGASRKRL